MLWAVVSSACCWASRPRRAVLRPKKLEIEDIALGLEVQGPELGPRAAGRGRRGGVRLARRAVGAGVVVGADHAREVVEEGELLAHEGAVDRVLAGDLGQQAAQLGAALAGPLRVGGGH